MCDFRHADWREYIRKNVTLQRQSIIMPDRPDIAINEEDIESLRRGSVQTFTSLYRVFVPRLLSFMYKATQNKEDAEEIVNDIMMNLWNIRSSLRSDSNIPALLFAIAYRRRIDYFRSRLKAPIYRDYMDFQDLLPSHDSHRIEYKDFCKIVNRAIDKLPQRIRDIVVLSRIKGLDNQEIAQRLDISIKTVNNSISIGLKLLYEQLGMKKN